MEYRSIAVGGTFEMLHKGHHFLLSKCFEYADEVVIGLTSDLFAQKLGKNLKYDFNYRKIQLEKFLSEEFPKRKYSIWELQDYFGPAILLESIEAIIVTSDNSDRVKLANDMRVSKDISPLKILSIDLIQAQDGVPISSTRILHGEIDNEGNVIK